jgi:hexosaminidase
MCFFCLQHCMPQYPVFFEKKDGLEDTTTPSTPDKKLSAHTACEIGRDTLECPHQMDDCASHPCNASEECLDGFNTYLCRAINTNTAPACNSSPVGNILKIMPLGDSITYVQGSYRGYLHTLLKNNGYTADFVGTLSDAASGGTDPDHEGHNGATIGPSLHGQWGDDPKTGYKNDLYDLVPTFMAKQPHVILLLIGINDYTNYTNMPGYDANTQSGEKYKNLLARIFAADPNVTVLAASLLPTSPARTPRGGTAPLNTAVQNHVSFYKSKGKNIYFVDMYNAAGISTSQDLYDGLHPSEKGGQKMAALWYNTLIQYVLPKKTSTETSVCVNNSTFPPNPTANSGNIQLLPMPDTYTQRVGHVETTSANRIVIRDPQAMDAAYTLSEKLNPFLQCALQVVINPSCLQKGDIVLTTDTSLVAHTYQVHVDNYIELKASDIATLNLSTSVLMQLAKTHGIPTRTLLFPRVSIKDTSDFSYRSIMVDVARQYHSLEKLRQLIRLCHFYQINYMHLHLTDDQGFMFPSNVVPEASKRLAPGAVKNYTQQELKDLVAYAYKHGVILVPEIDTPAHSHALIISYPDDFWLNTCSIPGFTGCRYHHASINFANPNVLTKMQNLFREVADVFYTSPYIHAGGDEADLTYAAQDTHMQNLANKYAASFKNGSSILMHRMFNWYLNQINEVVKSKGKQLILWEGFSASETDLLSKIDKSVIVMPFDNHHSGPYYISNGHKVINSSWTPLYVVGERRPSPNRIYDWDITQFGTYANHQDNTYYHTSSNTSQILGAEMCSWETPQADEIQAFHSRLPAMSERIKNRSFKDKNSFQERRESMFNVFQTYESSQGVVFETFGTTEDGDGFYSREAAVQMKTLLPNTEIRFTTNGSEPTKTSALYTTTQHYGSSSTTILRIHAAAFDKNTGEKTGTTGSLWLQYRPHVAAFRPLSVNNNKPQRQQGVWFDKDTTNVLQTSTNETVEIDLEDKSLIEKIKLHTNPNTSPQFSLKGQYKNSPVFDILIPSQTGASSGTAFFVEYTFPTQSLTKIVLSFSNIYPIKEIEILSASVSTQEPSLTYGSFRGETLTRTPWVGRNIAYMTDPKNTFQPTASNMSSVLNTLDRAYDFYQKATGYTPYLASQHRNRLRITHTANTCGAACGYVGATGIEITPYFSNILLTNGAPNTSNHAYNEVLFYELGRNFYGFEPKIQTNPAVVINIAEAFAVLMRKWSMEQSGAAPSEEEIRWQRMAQEQALRYAQESYTESHWEKTMKQGGDRAVAVYVGMWSLMGDAFGTSFKNRFWKEVTMRPDVVNNNPNKPAYIYALDNMYIAACKASERNLKRVFVDMFKWPVSADAIAEMTLLYGEP